MIIEEILANITLKSPFPPESFPKYQDIVLKKNNLFTIYPDMSRSIGDIISIIGMITSEKSSLLSMIYCFLFNKQTGVIQAYFDDGLLTFLHTHNYTELGYVAEGQFHTNIGGRDYLFNQGDLFLIDKNILHNEYLYRKNSVVLFLSIANNFFDKTMRHDVYDNETEKFIQRFVIGGGYHFVRFIPRVGKSQIPGLFEKIISEIWQPHPGTIHLVIGYVEWILNLLPIEYEVVIQQNDRILASDFLFKEIKRYLEYNYQDVTLKELIKQFGHNMNYFNRLIKAHTGMTFSGFVQNIKLEKAEFLLKTTDFPVEEVARQVGYNNLSYFYAIFRKKFKLTPNNIRDPKYPS